MSMRVLATRRQILRYGAGAAGALTLGALSFPATAADKKFNIALSNAYNGNEWRKRFCIAHRKRMCRTRNSKITSTTRARSRLPRTCWRGIFTLPG